MNKSQTDIEMLYYRRREKRYSVDKEEMIRYSHGRQSEKEGEKRKEKATVSF